MWNKQYIYWSIHRYTYIWGKSVLSVHVNKRQESLLLQDKKEKPHIFNVRLKAARLEVSAVFHFASYSTVASIIKEVKKKVMSAGRRNLDSMCKCAHAERSEDHGNVPPPLRGHKSRIPEPRKTGSSKKRSSRCLNWERHFRSKMFFFYR